MCCKKKVYIIQSIYNYMQLYLFGDCVFSNLKESFLNSTQILINGEWG